MRGDAKAPDAPFAIWTKIKSGDYLVAVDARAQKLGLKPGMTVTDARAMRPSLRLEQANPQADADLLASIADWHHRFTPLAAIDPPDGVMLDVAGAAHLFGGETALLNEIERRLEAQGFTARAAIAPSPALARALARFQVEWTPVDHSESALILKNGAPSDAKPASTFAELAPTRFSYIHIRRIPPQASQQEIESVAARLPVAALGLAARAQDSLLRAGLRHVGDLLERPRAPIAARFGAGTLARLDALICKIFERPEPIEAIALTPDGPPLRFRWRRALHEIAAFEGPERIAPQWWEPQERMLTRDYFYAEDREGRKFWLFRAGLYERECVTPHWFVHGLS